MKWPLLKPVAKTPAAKTPQRAPQGEFHAVDIVRGPDCCESVELLEGTRYLSRERPPALPLSGCSTPATCQCRYRHHEDRRSESRRASDHIWGAAGQRPVQQERRRSGGRRATDH